MDLMPLRFHRVSGTTTCCLCFFNEKEETKLVKIDEARAFHFLKASTCVENGNIVNVICAESHAYIRRNESIRFIK